MMATIPVIAKSANDVYLTATPLLTPSNRRASIRGPS